MKLLAKLRREAGHGDQVPRGWYMAWYDRRRRIGVYYPSLLHRLLRLLRDVFYRVRMAVRGPQSERTQVLEAQRAHHDRARLADEYARGYLAGWRECFHACLSAVEEEFTDSRQIWTMGDLLTNDSPSQKDN